MRILTCSIVGFALALLPMMQVANADIIITNSESTYNTMLASLGLTNVTTQDFDSTASGTAVANGSSLTAFTFTGLPGGAGVDSSYVTTSGSNYLAVLSGGTFTSGGLTFSFAATNAFAMKIITSNKFPTLSNDDFTLEAGGQSLSMSVADSTLVTGVPPFSSESYFFGIINTDSSFTSATFLKNSADDLNYFVDDLQIAGIPTFAVGDVNQDGAINLLDVAPFIDVLSTGEYQFEADIDGNGVVNLLDVEPFVLLLSGG